MLSKKNRLSTPLFQEVIKNGKRADSFLFSLTFLEGTNQKTALSVVVSKKVAARAVKRNELRRRVYAALVGLNLLPGLVIIFPKKGALSAKFNSLETDLRDLLYKCGRITQ